MIVALVYCVIKSIIIAFNYFDYKLTYFFNVVIYNIDIYEVIFYLENNILC